MNVPRALWPWCGLAYGCVLWLFAFANMGMGHGTYLPMTMYAAPLSLVPVVALFSPPAWWMLLGWLLRSSRRWLVALLVIHLLTVAIVLVVGTPGEPGAEQRVYFAYTLRTQPAFVWGGIALYAAGLLVICRVLVQPNAS